MTRPSFPPLPAAHWLFAGVALVIAPHALRLPAWIVALASALLAWRWLAAAGRLPLPGRWLLATLLVAAAAGLFLQYRTLLGRDAGVATLTLMLALKLLEMRSRRDAMLAVFLACFLCITHFFYRQDLPIAVYLLAVVWVLGAALIALNHPKARPWQAPLRHSASLLLQALPFMLLLFLLFPRPAGPLWGLPGDAFFARSGLSESMAPGSISRLVQSDAVAFRAEFAGTPPPASRLYWRALVLEDFDGRSWRLGRGGPPAAAAIETRGAALSYTLSIEAHAKPWVFALEIPDPLALPPDTVLTPTLQLLAKKNIEQRRRYALTAYLDHRFGHEAEPAELRRALSLPPSGNPRARALARQLRERSAGPGELVERVLEHFRTQGYAYTLSPPLLGEDSVDAFLFDARRGFCEHYAGAFTFLMRAAGVPARIVTGYQGGEFNPVGNYLVVRQSDAHAWSEVWLEERGWVRVDPTAAVAAGRIERGIAAALAAGEPLPFFVRTDLTWLKALRQRWDALNNEWDQWVPGYDQETQIGLFARLGLGIVSWRELALGLAIGLALLALGLAALVLKNRGRPAPDRVEALYRRYCRRLARAGIKRPATEGPLDLARRVAEKRPELADSAAAIARLYAELRYGRNPSAEALRELAARVKGFRA